MDNLKHKTDIRPYISGTVFFATPDYECAVDQAVHYCKDNGLTPEDVKIARTENMVIVKKR